MICFRYKVLCVIFFLTSVALLMAVDKPIGFYRFNGLYLQGAKRCQELLAQSQSPTMRKKLLFELAACYQFNTRERAYRKAIAIYRQFIEEFPQDPLCAKAYFNIGRCYDVFTTEREKDIEQARQAYQTCYENYKRSLWADQAFFWYANSFIYRLNPQSAASGVKIFKEFLEHFPNSFLRGVAHSQLSELYCAWLNNYQAAVKHSELALRQGIQDINLRRLHLYRLGYLYQFKLKDNENAVKWYKKLIAESPTKSDPNYFVAAMRIKELEHKHDK